VVTSGRVAGRDSEGLDMFDRGSAKLGVDIRAVYEHGDDL
jgi:hypothetical protein